MFLFFLTIYFEKTWAFEVAALDIMYFTRSKFLKNLQFIRKLLPLYHKVFKLVYFFW